ncbi:hypothetical protein NL676_037339 [Syzygium grande]|nr:hypothetical protein NL676_037339 [Syzygium grande]
MSIPNREPNRAEGEAVNLKNDGDTTLHRAAADKQIELMLVYGLAMYKRPLLCNPILPCEQPTRIVLILSVTVQKLENCEKREGQCQARTQISREERKSNTNSPRANGAICRLAIYFTSGGEWTPWSIPVFVLANFATFAAAMHFNLCLRGRSWSRDNGSCKIGQDGAVERYKVVYQNQGWRLITAMLWHADVVHILLNNSILAVFGFGLQQLFSFMRGGTIYLSSGFGGSILSLLFVQDGMAVGASCAIYGVIGAMIFKLINNFRHIGGLLTGFLLGFVLPQHGWVNSQDHSDDAHANKPKYNRYQYLLWLLGLALLIIGQV